MKERRLTSVKSTIGALALISGIAVSGIARAANSDALIGNWKLVSWQVVVGEEIQNSFGSSLLTPGGRAMAITTAGSRKPGDGVAQRAALHKSMLAYSGKYRIEGSDFITPRNIPWIKT